MTPPQLRAPNVATAAIPCKPDAGYGRRLAKPRLDSPASPGYTGISGAQMHRARHEAGRESHRFGARGSASARCGLLERGDALIERRMAEEQPLEAARAFARGNAERGELRGQRLVRGLQ